MKDNDLKHDLKSEIGSIFLILEKLKTKEMSIDLLISNFEMIRRKKKSIDSNIEKIEVIKCV